MRKSNGSLASISQNEIVWGWAYWLVQLLLLPGLLKYGNTLLPHPLTGAQVNFLFFLLNFLAVVWIFNGFLEKSAAQVTAHPALFCQAVVLGLAAYYACLFLINWCVRKLEPGFVNVNDASIAALAKGDYFLMIVGTVILVPLAEECFYRGLFFRTLYGKSHWAAYLVSMCVFAFIHIAGFLTASSPLTLVLCFLQYLPAGLCLAWCYTKAGTIFAPVAVHAVINALTIYFMR